MRLTFVVVAVAAFGCLPAAIYTRSIRYDGSTTRSVDERATFYQAGTAATTDWSLGVDQPPVPTPAQRATGYLVWVAGAMTLLGALGWGLRLIPVVGAWLPAGVPALLTLAGAGSLVFFLWLDQASPWLLLGFLLAGAAVAYLISIHHNTTLGGTHA